MLFKCDSAMFQCSLLVVVGTRAVVTHDCYLHDNLEAVTQYDLGPNELVIANQIKDVGEKIEFKANQKAVSWSLFSSTSVCITYVA